MNVNYDVTMRDIRVTREHTMLNANVQRALNITDHTQTHTSIYTDHTHTDTHCIITSDD